jgi:small conductance mechanosensitive channel
MGHILLTTAVSQAESAIQEISEMEPDQAMNFLENYVKEKFLPGLVDFVKTIIFVILIYLIGRKLIKFILKILKRSFERAGMDVGVSMFLCSAVKIVLNAVMILIIVDVLGIETTSIVAIVGSAGLAVGLALQGSLSNFAGGVLILLLKPFRVGDYIIEDNKGNEGTVAKIDLFYTYLTTVDNRVVVIPNGTLANTSLTNVTAETVRRLDLNISVSYQEEVDEVKEVLRRILVSHSKVLQEKEISIFLNKFDASSVDIGMRMWVNAADYWNTRWDLMEQIKKEFDRLGIEIPYNQLDVTIKK